MNEKRINQRKLNIDERKKSFSLVLQPFNEDEMLAEANRCFGCSHPTCVDGCPIKNNIPEFIKLAKEKDYKKAYNLISENSIFPDICATICPHEKQCVGHCVKAHLGEEIHIGEIERFICDHAEKTNFNPTKNDIKIACIGSGPASLSFALYLARLGFKVDIFERDNHIGGVLSWGIPTFRLEEEKVEKYINELKELGVNFIINTHIQNIDILKKNYKAIFVGVGAPINNSMNLENENLRGIYSSYEFLYRVNYSMKNSISAKHLNNYGEHIIVVGGGNVAMDAARSAIRLPGVKDVKIVYRRSENEMPSCKEELELAKEEGIEFLTLTNPVRFIGDSKLEKVECAIMELGEPDNSGRRRPIETTKPHIFLDCDSLILALGFNNDKLLADTYKLESDKYGCLIVNDDNQTSTDYIYSGGDNTRGADTVVNAMKDGMNAAKALLKKLKM